MNTIQLKQALKENHLESHQIRISCHYLGSKIDYIIEQWHINDSTLTLSISDNPKKCYEERSTSTDTEHDTNNIPSCITSCSTLMSLLQAIPSPEARILVDLATENGNFMFGADKLVIDHHEKIAHLTAPDAEMVYETLYEEEKGSQYKLLKCLNIDYRNLRQMVDNPFSNRNILTFNATLHNATPLLPTLCTKILTEISQHPTKSTSSGRLSQETVHYIWHWYKETMATSATEWPPPRGKKLKREDHVPSLTAAREFLEKEHYIQNKRNTFTLTEKGEEVIKHGGFHGKFLVEIFREYTADDYWGSNLKASPKIFTSTFPLTLLIMHEMENRLLPLDLYAYHIMNMFPYSRTPKRVQNSMKKQPMSENFNEHMTTFLYIYTIKKLLTDFTLATLLDDPERTKQKTFWRPALVKKTHFFNQFVQVNSQIFSNGG